MLATSSLVRRSSLLIAVLDEAAVADCWRYGADTIVLTLPERQAAAPRSVAWERLAAAVCSAQRGGADTLVQIDKKLAYADVKAAVRSGTSIRGVVLPDVESATDVLEVEQFLLEREREEGIPPGDLEIMLLLGTPSGVWHVREIVSASPRITCVAIDEAQLCRSMGIVPTSDFDPLEFCRGRVIVETLAAVRLPLGIGHPLGALPGTMDAERFMALAERARNSGFKGAICHQPSWVAVCNTAFTPSDKEVAYYREVRQAFAQGIARGTAAVPFPGGRMIDVPVDERARLIIDWWARCQRRDAEKSAALQGLL